MVVALRRISWASIAVLTTSDRYADIQGTMLAGASGHVLKRMSKGEMLKITRAVHSRGRHVRPDVAGRLARRLGEATCELIRVPDCPYLLCPSYCGRPCCCCCSPRQRLPLSTLNSTFADTDTTPGESRTDSLMALPIQSRRPRMAISGLAAPMGCSAPMEFVSSPGRHLRESSYCLPLSPVLWLRGMEICGWDDAWLESFDQPRPDQLFVVRERSHGSQR